MNEITLGVAQVVATIIAGIGLCYTAWEINNSTKQRRIERVDSIRRELFGSDSLKDIYYQIEYSTFEYSPEFHQSDEEKKLDQLLVMFDSLAKQFEMGLLKIEDLYIIAYEYLVIFENSEVNEYINFLDEWFDTRGIPRQPFIAFRRVGERLQCIQEN